MLILFPYDAFLRKGNKSKIKFLKCHVLLPFTNGVILMILLFSGYMSPEYAMQGEFSTKSDVYSFGVLVMEIINGKKNSSFYQTDGAEDLLTYVSINVVILSHLD